MIKNIIFDFGGVIINVDYRLCKKALEPYSSVPFDQLFSQASQIRFFDDFEEGNMSEEAFRNELRKFIEIDLPDETLDEIWNAMILNYKAERFDLLKKVHKNYKTFLLSNSNSIHYRFFMNMLKETMHLDSLDPFFDKVYFSHDIHKRKPNPDIFQFVLDQNNLKPSETLFIDDSIQHVESARRLGLHAHHLQGEISELFDENGVLQIDN